MLDVIARAVLPISVRQVLGLFALNLAAKNRFTLIAWVYLVHGYKLKGIKIKGNTAFYSHDGYIVELPTDGIGAILEIFQGGVYDRLIKPGGGIVIDVGSHIGSFAIKSARAANKVIAIEPEPANFQNIVRNIARNKIENIYPVRQALSNEIGIAQFNVSKASACHSLVYKVGDETIPVKVNTLDNLLLDMGIEEPIDFIKIDAEGAEINVLKGAHKTLKHTSKVSVAAYHTTATGEAEIGTVMRILLDAGFKITGDKGLRSYVYAEKSL
jgi:FkbM family methyltransferase